MSLAKVYAQSAIYSGFTLKVEYSDIAGAYGGWFLIRVHGPLLEEPSPTSPYEIPSTDFVNAVGHAGTNGSGAWASGGSDGDRYGRSAQEQVNARLVRYLGEGHSAKWTATIVQDVTPAVINDDWGTP